MLPAFVTSTNLVNMSFWVFTQVINKILAKILLGMDSRGHYKREHLQSGLRPKTLACLVHLFNPP